MSSPVAFKPRGKTYCPNGLLLRSPAHYRNAGAHLCMREGKDTPSLPSPLCCPWRTCHRWDTAASRKPTGSQWSRRGARADCPAAGGGRVRERLPGTRQLRAFAQLLIISPSLTTGSLLQRRFFLSQKTHPFSKQLAHDAGKPQL